jgi:glyoxylate reductase
MKAYIFDSLWNELITESLNQRLSEAGIETVVISEIAPIKNCKELFLGNEERLLCINPDYVDRQLSSSDYKDIPNLKAILCAATALSWIDDTVANTRNIPICNIRNFSTDAVAEWAVMMLFNIARQTPILIKKNFPLDFGKDFITHSGMQLKGKKAGIIGMGNIGRAIAERLNGLGMEVSYWSRTTRLKDYTYCELEQLLKESDVIFPTFARNNTTHDLITDDLICSMKHNAILITIVRNIFNQELVIERVKQNKLFGFGFETQPEFFKCYEGNIWAAPSYAWATKESMHNSMTLWADNMINAANNLFPNRINL